MTNFILKSDKIGNQNVTEFVTLDTWKCFIVQQMLSFSDRKNVEFKNMVFDELKKSPWVKIAHNFKNFDRFYEFEGQIFQVMEVLPWRNFEQKDFSKKLGIQMVQILAKWHKALEKIDWGGYEDIDFSRVLFKIAPLAREKVWSSNRDDLKELFSEMEAKLEGLSEDSRLPKWVIHGDPIYRNYMISDDASEITWIIDYERACYNTLLWDVAEVIKGMLRFEEVDKEYVLVLLDEYNKIRPLTPLEWEKLPTYLKMINLCTAYRFILWEFEGTWFRNLHWDTCERIRRYLKEYDKWAEFWDLRIPEGTEI